MRLEDKRDEVLGALLRRAAQAAVEGSREAGPSGSDLPAARAGGVESVRQDRRFRIRARIAGAAALAAALAAAFLAPVLARRRADRELLDYAAEHLSRSLIRESSSFLAELTAASELASAAAAWAGALFRTDIDL